jgi:hypothetical protein
MSKTQSFEKHAAWQPMFHFLASPITMLAALHLTWVAITDPTNRHIGDAIYAIALAAGIFASRVMALTVQNRVIRLEMRLRLKEILPPALASRIKELTVRQLIALRFAGDAEMPALVERTLKGEFAKPRDIKAAITDWQPDFLRC